MRTVKIFLLSLPFLSLAWAQQCPVDPLAQTLSQSRFADRLRPATDGRIYAEADSSEGDYHRAQLAGNVIVNQGEKQFRADQVIYSASGERGQIPGTGLFSDTQMAVQGQNINFDLGQRTADVAAGDYYLTRQGASGRAENLHFDDEHRQDTMENATWSTCGRLNPDWHLQAEKLTLDRVQNRAIARNMTFHVGSLPLAYLPYFSYPIGKGRQSGFLIPRLRTSDSNGLELAVPYYWNIAPNRDATVTLRPMTKQGLMVEGEFRYLEQNYSGQLAGSYLISNKPRQRWSGLWEHKYEKDDWRSDLRFQQVSDRNYLEDFSNDLEETNDWFLERHWRTNYGKNWQLEWQDFQISDPTVLNKPYSKLPELSYQNQWEDGNLTLSAAASAAHFHKRRTVSGNRYNGQLSASYDLAGPGAFSRPKLIINGSHYDLNNGRRFNRLLPTFSWDNGLIFERQSQNFTQTLEPRLFYVYTPYRNQETFPSFDTTNLSFRWDNLFRENWFIGGDRVADNNELRYGLTSRFLKDEDGQEKARLSVGSIEYFTRPRVRRFDDFGTEQRKRLIASELEYQINDQWQLAAVNLHNGTDNRSQYSMLDLRYKLAPVQLVSLAHRFRRDRFSQLSLQGQWRINDRWKTFFRQDYSLNENRLFHDMLGVEYDDCCWSLRLAGKRHRRSPSDGRMNNTLYFEFMFKGLGSLGRSAKPLLENDIKEF